MRTRRAVKYNINQFLLRDNKMETRQKRTKILVSLLALAGLVVVSTFTMAGDLEPPGAPGSTMKTLDEVEPRIPISQDNIPFLINGSGSYYLTEDINSTVTAIIVEVNDVTIDLSGFTLDGPDSGTNYGIYMSGRSNVEIRSGTVRDFHYGIYDDAIGSGLGHRVIDVRSLSNGAHGIYLPSKNNLVKDCTVSDNGEEATGGDVYGIYVVLTVARVLKNTTKPFTFWFNTRESARYISEMVKVISRLLERSGHKVTSHTNPDDAIAAYRKQRHDIVITDIGMSAMTGWELAQKIKGIYQEAAIVFITGWGAQVDHEKARQIGAKGIINKPLSKDKILGTINSILKDKK